LFVSVKLFATLANYFPGAQSGLPFVIEIPEGSTISDLMKRLRLPEKEVNLFFVNGRNQLGQYQLNNNDDVGFFPLIGGG
jgi:sulfur-carrier protein